MRVVVVDRDLGPAPQALERDERLGRASPPPAVMTYAAASPAGARPNARA